MREETNSAQKHKDLARAVRARNMAEAWASVELEGYTPSAEARAIGQQYVDGNITAQEQVNLIRARHGLAPDKETDR